MRTRSTFSISLVVFLWLGQAMAQESAAINTLSMQRVSLAEALDTLISRYGIALVYRDRDVESLLVSLSCRECTAEEVLNQLLLDTELGWERKGRQYLVMRKRTPERPLHGTLWGFAADSLSGRPLPEASVLLFADNREPSAGQPVRWCSTNRYGFYSLASVDSGPYTVVVRSVGYRAHTTSVSVEAGSPAHHSFSLVPEDIELHEVVVEARRPPVVPLADLSGSIYIQGAPSDQDLTIVDGMPIYNPEHIGGMLYAFAPEALQEVRLREKDLPPSYGERIGGVLDVTLREGARDRFAGSAGIGFVNSYLTLEGPIGAGATFIVSARRVYPDVLVGRLTSVSRASHLNYSDALVKLAVTLSRADRLLFSGYMSGDVYDHRAQTQTAALENDLRWGNGALSARWAHVLSHAVFATTSVVYSRFNLDAEQRWTGVSGAGPLPTPVRAPSRAAISEVSLNTYLQYVHDGQHTLSGGVAVSVYELTAQVNSFSTQISEISFGRLRPFEICAHIEHEWHLAPTFTTRLGLRATGFANEGSTLLSFDPRLSCDIRVSESLTLFSSFAAVTQFLHPYNQSGLFLFFPISVWYPSTEIVRPSRSLQVSAGAEVLLPGENHRISARGYYRQTDDVHEFVVPPPPEAEHDFRKALVFGRGVAYGLSFTWRRTGERWEGLVSYDLAWIRHRFAEFNDGEPYFPRMDRRHEVSVGFAFVPAPRWQVRASWVYSSNQSPSFYPRVDKSNGIVDNGFRGHDEVTSPLGASNFVAVNGSKIPGFQRLDVMIGHEFGGLGIPIQLSLRLHNAYAVLDPFSWGLRDAGDPRLQWWVDVDPPGLFPLFPSADVSIRF